MAWTAPITFVPNQPPTAAQMNAFLRDNMLETEAAKAQTIGSYFVSTGPNQIAERSTVSAIQAATGTRSDVAYGALTDGGVNPEVTVQTGTRALVLISARMAAATGNPTSVTLVSVALSGATTANGADNRAIGYQGVAPNQFGWAGVYQLNPGVNTFTMVYRRTVGGNAVFSNRQLTVFPF